VLIPFAVEIYFRNFECFLIEMNRKIILIASLFGLTAILFGAFGAHALKSLLNENQLISFETGVRYQMYHALFLLFLGTTSFVTEKVKKMIFYMVIIGVFIFSGSIYLLATNDVTSIDFKFLGPITPIGGLLLIGAWIALFLNILKQKG
jgi:uncharacterized membrane protein YgdD (TMEM256/DUF423 family)